MSGQTVGISSDRFRHICWEIESLVKELGMAGYCGNISPQVFIGATGHPEKDVLEALFRVAQHGYLEFLLMAVCGEGEPHEIREFKFEAIGDWADPRFKALDPDFLLPQEGDPLKIRCGRCGQDAEISRDDLFIWFRIPDDYLKFLTPKTQNNRRRLRPIVG